MGRDWVRGNNCKRQPKRGGEGEIGANVFHFSSLGFGAEQCDKKALPQLPKHASTRRRRTYTACTHCTTVGHIVAYYVVTKPALTWAPFQHAITSCARVCVCVCDHNCSACLPASNNNNKSNNYSTHTHAHRHSKAAITAAFLRACVLAAPA